MNVQPIAQPEVQLGNEIGNLLEAENTFSNICFVSAFVSLQTISRFREKLLKQKKNGARLKLIVGIDLGGTSREVIEELLKWDCEAFIFHNAIPRSTFHPKIYLFESRDAATVFIGSNNLTEGGFYTNYEAALRCRFKFPEEADEYACFMEPLRVFLEPQSTAALKLDAELFQTLVERGTLLTEADARQHSGQTGESSSRNDAGAPPNPFPSIPVPLPPSLPQRAKPGEAIVFPSTKPQGGGPATAARIPKAQKSLVWRKSLSASDAVSPQVGSNSVGGVRLTQARFEVNGRRIDQTTYFRNLFKRSHWKPEAGGRGGQEHAIVPIHLFIKGNDFGIRDFEISHKPSGEAGQGNYTTILRWGRELSPTIREQSLTGATFSLYEVPDGEAGFLIEITEA